MMKKSTFAGIASVVALSTALAGCGSQTSTPAPQQSGGENTGGAGGAGGKIVIAGIGPLSGSASDYGDSAISGAQYALDLKKEEFKKLGFDLELLKQDDQADPKQGVASAEMVISNPDVLAVMGHITTGSSIPSSAKYEEAKLVMVSPSSTGSKLTDDGKKTVHRICARDDQQGSKAAIYAKNQLGVKTAFIIHDKGAYGQGLADQVKQQLEKDGVQVLGFEGITPGEKDYSAVINQVVGKNPDLLYFGGYYAEGGILVKQAREKNYKGIFMGGDGLDSADMAKIAGPAVEGVVYTSTVDDVASTEEGKKWVAEYEKASGKKSGIFTSYGFDSMNVILHGVEEAIKANGGKKPSREQVLDAVHKISDFQGQFVKVSFDEKGDNKYAAVYAYKYEGTGKKFLGEAK
ncbi:branched-chain amino acid ABC transporter substrate-binding protein [Brevibacillus sp. SYSU BS000544]|uniref:branched-chain amino acid ABC transporter substrate-binding protein n=1 Tax=Brevibacillus sp. SYSU BS000544 TaxID=3416443 RepID=UPI003CE47B3C